MAVRDGQHFLFCPVQMALFASVVFATTLSCSTSDRMDRPPRRDSVVSEQRAETRPVTEAPESPSESAQGEGSTAPPFLETKPAAETEGGSVQDASPIGPALNSAATTAERSTAIPETQPSSEQPQPTLEERARMERELFRKRIGEAERARIAFLEQERIYEDLLRQHLEMERRRRREEALDREQPQRRLFFYRDAAAELGAEGTITVPKGKRLVLFRNSPVQYNGISVLRLPCPVGVRDSRSIDRGEDLNALLLAEKGDWILALDDKTENQSGRETASCEIVPVKSGHVLFFPINIHSDGANYYRIDAESSEKNYFIWIPERITAVYE